jgi:3-oxoadipate enol-lactonase
MPKASINGINMNYNIEGQGEPLIMIMGLGSTSAAWRFQRRFFRKYYKVITFDNRGAGKTDKPAGPYSMKLMANDTVALMDNLAIEKSHVMGVSMGGKIAQEVAINYPERVDKLVLANTYCCQDDSMNGWTPEWTAAVDRFCETWKAPRVGIAFNGPLWRFFGFFQIRISTMRKTPEEKAGYLAQKKAAETVHTIDRLPSVKARTLVITGTGDNLTRHTSSDTMAKIIPNAKLVKIIGGSHTLIVERSGEFNKVVLNFLKNG